MLPAVLGGGAGSQVGLPLNFLYEQAQANSLCSDIYDLIQDRKVYDYQKPPKCLKSTEFSHNSSTKTSQQPT